MAEQHLFKQSIEELISEYRLHLEATNRSQKTISWYLDILHKFFLNIIPSQEISKQIGDIGRRELDAYILQLRQSKRWPNKAEHKKDYGKLSPFTIQGKVRALKAFWSWLLKQNYIENNPLAGYALPSVPKKIMPIIEKEQISKLFGAIDKYSPLGCRNYCILLILLDTGVRVSELACIKLIDMNMNQGIVKLVGKRQKERIVPLHPITRRELIKYLKHHRPNLCSEESEYLFPLSQGRHISVNCIQQMIRRLAKKAGLQNIKCHPHVFRHTCATRFIMKGGSPVILKEIMGHESFQTTEKYIHPQGDDLKRQHMKYSPVADLFEG
jgi:site-specific recombinase XerD